MTGSPAILADQLRHLVPLGEAEHVDLLVLPFSAGAHPAMAGAFRILDFDDPDDPDVVYLESQVGAQ